VAVLLQSGADRCAVDSQGLTVLHQLLAQEPFVNGRLLRLLVQCSPRPHSSSTLSDVHTELFSSRVLHAKTKSDGNTALHLAWRHPETAQTLLELGARVDEPNTAGHTPLVNNDLLTAACVYCVRYSVFYQVLHASTQA
jgi:Ankyrin repeat